MRKLLKSEAGFTLVELLIVLMVLGILATIAIPRFKDMSGKANQVKMKSELKQVQTALELYYAENNEYPVDDAAFEPALDDLVEDVDIAAYEFAYTRTDAKTYSIDVKEAGGADVVATITRGNIDTN
jgi:general secretion pathway protein G